VTDCEGSGHGSPPMRALALEAEAGSGSGPEAATRERRVEAMFRAHYPFVRRMLRYWGTPPSALEDATQDVFIVVTRSLERLRDDVDERSWLLGIARRIARNHRRTSLRHRVRCFVLGAARVEPPAPLDARHERAALAVRLLQELPEPQRVIVVLGDLEGWTAPEIAEALGINLNTVYSRLRLARRRMEALRREWVATEESPS